MQISDVRAVVVDFVAAVRDTSASLRDDETRINAQTAAHDKRKADLAAVLRRAAADVRQILRT